MHLTMGETPLAPPAMTRPSPWPAVLAGLVAAGLWAALLALPAYASHPAMAALIAAPILPVFSLGRRLAGGWVGFFGAALFAVAILAQYSANPLVPWPASFPFRQFSVSPPLPFFPPRLIAAVLLPAGCWMLLRFVDYSSPARGLIAGLLLGALIFFSRTATVGAIVAVGWLCWHERLSSRLWSVVVGLALPVGWFSLGASPAADAIWAHPPRLPAGTAALPDSSLGVVSAPGGLWLLLFVLGAAGLAALIFVIRRRGEGVLLAAITVAVTAFGTGAVGVGPGPHLGTFFLPFVAIAAAWLLTLAYGVGTRGSRIAVATVAGTLLALGAIAISHGPQTPTDADRLHAAINGDAAEEQQL